ncbi:MAG TPA: serine/threonine-protein kinase [Leptolyngbyaceae cyanobacterium]
MTNESSLPPTNRQSSAKTQLTKTTLTASARQSSRLKSLTHVLTGAWALLAAIATSANLGLVQNIENKVQTLFFELRGPVSPPDDVVILAMDDESLMQGREIYLTDPKKFAYLEPLKQWPWKRSAYALAIDRLMKAGARSVALDVLFDTPSRYGTADDRQLQQVLERYAGRVTLAASYENTQTRQGISTQLILPQAQFWTKPISIGSVNYPLEMDGRIRRFATEYNKRLAEEYQDQLKNFDPLKLKISSFDFDKATLQAANLTYPQPKGDRLYFYGPNKTFTHIPFWYVLDSDNWNTFKEQFKNKIVLIGPTANELKDFHKVPFSESWLYPDPMSGVEIHASAIATLMQGRAIGQAISHPALRGLFVFVGLLATGFFVSQRKQALTRFSWSIGILLAWGSISYFIFIYGQLILPTAVPIVAIALGGVSYLTSGIATQQLKKVELRQILKQYATSPIVQKIISQHDELQDLIPAEEINQANKIIGNRYQIIKVLGSGGFGETYIAQDGQRPGKPLCVVKQLKPATNNPKHLELARRLFPREAEALEKLGQHSQIPQLLAYFEEEEEFYLVQEYIDGHPLEQELVSGKKLSENEVKGILIELLEILEFVHSYGVIHRDIKPNNIIRRHSDNKLVLIDFGAVKEVTSQLLDTDNLSRFTVGIGTQGYAPPEQCAGRPRPNSDIYAVGITAIKGLTGLSPNQLQQDIRTGEILWTHKAEIKPEFAAIISKMVRYDFSQRYQTATEVKEDILTFETTSQSSFTLIDKPIDILASEELEDLEADTKPWLEKSETLYTLEKTQDL